MSQRREEGGLQSWSKTHVYSYVSVDNFTPADVNTGVQLYIYVDKLYNFTRVGVHLYTCHTAILIIIDG